MRYSTNSDSGPGTAPIANRLVLAASALVAVVALLAYAPTMTSYFNAEDFGAIQLYSNDTFAHWLTTVFDDYTQGMWGFRCPSMRPVESLNYMIESKLWLGNPLGYHLSNMTAHALCSWLVMWIAWRLTPAGLAASTVSGLLFGLHATHIEAVSWVAGRTDLIFSSLALLTVYWFGRFRAGGRSRDLALSLAGTTMALLSKEMGVIVPFLLVGYDALLAGDRRSRFRLERYRVHLPFFMLLLAYLAIRWSVFGVPLSNGLRADGKVTVQMIVEFFAGQVRLLNLLVIPVNLFETRVPEGLLLVLPLGLVIAAVVAIWHTRHRPAVRSVLVPCLYFGPVWYALTIAPLLYAYAASRYLYLPSAGLCIALPMLLGRMLPRRAATITALAGLVLMGALLTHENLRWRRVMALASSIQGEVVRLDAELPDDTKFLLDIPFYVEGIQLWPTSLPFAFEPPFAPAGLSARVLEMPELYYHEGLWSRDRMKLLSAIARSPETSYIVRVDQNRAVRSARLKQDETLTVLRRFRAGHR